MFGEAGASNDFSASFVQHPGDKARYKLYSSLQTAKMETENLVLLVGLLVKKINVYYSGGNDVAIRELQGNNDFDKV
jgi:hypothetical protein